MMLTKICGCCNGVGKVFMVRPTTGPTQVEDCTNCGGNGVVINMDNFVISFKRYDEFPKTMMKSCKQ